MHASSLPSMASIINLFATSFRSESLLWAYTKILVSTNIIIDVFPVDIAQNFTHMISLFKGFFKVLIGIICFRNNNLYFIRFWQIDMFYRFKYPILIYCFDGLWHEFTPFSRLRITRIDNRVKKCCRDLSLILPREWYPWGPYNNLFSLSGKFYSPIDGSLVCSLVSPPTTSGYSYFVWV